MATPEPNIKQHERLIIIGSGPVGMVAALKLRHNFKEVILLERQNKQTFLEKNGFTFPIVFTLTAIRLLKSVDVWEAIQSEQSEYFGVVIHKRLMGEERIVENVRPGIYAHWRNHIVNSLYDRIAQEDNIEIRFESTVTDIDFERNICVEETAGELPFDLLVGADGIRSITRRLMAQAHPKHAPDEFKLELIDYWHAYRMPSVGKLRDAFGGGERHLASHVYLDSQSPYPSEKFRLITTNMRFPQDEISILTRYAPNVPQSRARTLNQMVVGPLVDSLDDLNHAWDTGIQGRFEQVITPTYSLNSVVLLGDAAHGFPSAGDLINVGMTSIEDFYQILNKHEHVRDAVREYDETSGAATRVYAEYAHRRGKGQAQSELFLFRLARRFDLVRPHPSVYGVRAPNFNMKQCMDDYAEDLRKVRMLFYGVPAAAAALLLLILLVVGALV